MTADNIQQCVLAIWYNRKRYPQGKVFLSGSTWYYLANVDAQKLVRKLNGYAISIRILEAFEVVGITPVILYKNTDTHIVYSAKLSLLRAKGIPFHYGDHRQLVLPLSYWTPVKVNTVGDPKGLPVIDVQDWAQGITEELEMVNGIPTIKRIERPVQQSFL